MPATKTILLLIAVILFVIHFAVKYGGGDTGKVDLKAAGLAFFAGSFLV